MSIQPFKVDISQETLLRIESRLKNATWPERLGDGGWSFGISYDYMKELVSYWTTQYEWRETEKKLNAFPQYKAHIEDYNIHFYHVPGSGPLPLPLILTHGWPGSVMEFLDVIEPLTNPEKFGGRAADSFTVVIPSLPGFGFSSKPIKEPIGPASTARLWHKLMTEVLGYSRYGAQGGDLGSLVTTLLAHQYPDELIGIHLNIIPIAASTVAENADEEAWQQQVQQFTQAEMAYFGLQATKPQTPSFALMDSPLGTAAWIVEKMKAWSDSGDSIEDAFSKDQILSNVMLYLVTGTIDSSIWFYRGFVMETGGSFHPGSRIEVPTGIANSPREMIVGKPPRSMAERHFNLQHWAEQPRGGHFAAFEQPELFVKDVQTFFQTVRS